MRLVSLASTEFLVEQKNVGGGSGANFIFEWVAEQDVNQPVIETVMVGIKEKASISFVRSGVAIQSK